MKALRQALRIAMLLLMGAVAMGAGGWVRTMVDISPPASAAESHGPDGVSDGGEVLDLFRMDTPFGPVASPEPPFGWEGLRTEFETLGPVTDALDRLFDPAGLGTEQTDDGQDLPELLNDLKFWSAPPEQDRRGAPVFPSPSSPVPHETEDRPSPLALRHSPDRRPPHQRTRSLTPAARHRRRPRGLRRNAWTRTRGPGSVRVPITMPGATIA